MLHIYKTTEQGVETLDAIIPGCWINAVDPTPAETQQLIESGIDNDYVSYSLDEDEMARVEREDEYTFILIRIPIFQGAHADVPYTTAPLGIYIQEHMVTTICRHESDVFKVLTNGKYRGLRTGKRYRLALYIFLETSLRYLNCLRTINKTTDALEDQLQKSTRNREVLELLKYQKSLTYFSTALRSNEVMMERLQRMQMFNQYEEDQDLLEDVLTENQQAIQMVNIATELLSALMDAFASIISNNLNSVMKVLAALTIVTALPGTVGAFFGMNVALPFSEASPYSFFSVLGISIALSAIAAYIFYKRDWF
jgi:magnesium transporter